MDLPGYDGWKTTDYLAEEENVRREAEDHLEELRDEREALEKLNVEPSQELLDDINHLRNFLNT